jgi:putative flippase GtrA
MDALAAPARYRQAASTAFLGSHRRFLSFATIGVASTLAYVALYTAIRPALGAPAANALALLVTALANTAANRRLTFEVRGRAGLARDHAVGLLALLVALGITSASLAALVFARPRPGALLELAVLVSANALATLVRFMLLRRVIGKSLRFQERAATTLVTLFRLERNHR